MEFDEIIDRRGTNAVKTDVLEERFGRADLMPLWVADMDWPTPPFVRDALRRALDVPVLGYTVTPPAYAGSIARWLEARHGWRVDTEAITFIPGVVKGIGMALNHFLKPGEKVIIQPPVYHPFRLTPQDQGIGVVENPLKELPDGGYAMDFEGLERVADESCRMLLLSNPHNPGGVVWDAATLRRLAEICYRRGIIVVSDEIHADMALYGHRHTPFATVSREAEACSVTFGAPSKTFNLAGIVSSYAVVPDPKLRQSFFSWLKANEFDDAPTLSAVATMAAFSGEGDQWRRRMLRYVEENVDFVEEFCRRNIPGIKAVKPQASFLVWLDCRGLGLDHDSLVSLFVDKAGLALNDGEMFGPGGEGHMRLNVAAPREVIAEAMRRLQQAVTELTR